MRKEEKKKQADELRIRMDEVKKERKALRNALKIQKDEEQKIKMLQKGSNDSRKGSTEEGGKHRHGIAAIFAWISARKCLSRSGTPCDDRSLTFPQEKSGSNLSKSQIIELDFFY